MARSGTGGFLSRCAVLAAALGMVAGCMGIRHPPNLAGSTNPIDYAPDAKLYTTPNGMQLLVLPNAQTNLVQVDMRYLVGAAEDLPDKAGLAHLVEHLTFQIQPEGNGGPTLADTLGEDVLFYNAYTNWDATRYTAIGFRDDLEKLLAIESRRMTAKCEQITEGRLALEREVVRNEIREHASPIRAGYGLLRDAVYGAGHAYQHDVGGTEEDLARITHADVCAFLDGHYAPDRAILTVSGNVDPQTVAVLTGRFFSPITKQAQTPRRTIDAPRLAGSSIQHELDVDEPTALIAFNAVPFGASKAIEQRILVAAMQTRLSAMVRKHDFLSAAHISVAGGRRAPLLIVALSVKYPFRLALAVDYFFANVEELASDPFSDSLIASLRELHLARFLFEVEPFMDKAEIFTDYLQYTDHHRFVNNELDRLQRVSLTTLHLQARPMFRRSASSILYLWPKLDTDAPTERAALQLSPEINDIHDWRMPVDVTEAEAPFEVPRREMHAQVHSFMLDNGLQVLLAPSLHVPVVDIRMIFPAGSLNDPPALPGLARLAMIFLKHDYRALFALSSGVPIEQTKAALLHTGGAVNHTLSERTTTFRIGGLSRQLGGFLWTLHWLLERGIYADIEYDELADKVQHTVDDDDSDTRHVHALLEAVFGSGHPYATDKDIWSTMRKISVADLQRFRDNYYRLEGATLILTGRFDAAFAEAEIRRMFDWARDTTQKELPTAPASLQLPGQKAEQPVKKPTWPLIRQKVPAAAKRSESAYLAKFDEGSTQTRVLFAFGLDAGIAEHDAARMVLHEMVEEKMSALREHLGATYGVTVRQMWEVGPGLLIIAAAVDRERAGEAMIAMRQALDELRSGDVAAAFVRARRRAVRILLADALDSGSVANELEHVVAHELEHDYFGKLAQRVGALRLDEVRALIARALVHEVMLGYGQRASVEAMYGQAGIASWRVIE